MEKINFEGKIHQQVYMSLSSVFNSSDLPISWSSSSHFIFRGRYSSLGVYSEHILDLTKPGGPYKASSDCLILHKGSLELTTILCDSKSGHNLI